MPLPYHPRPGTLVVCDYSMGGFVPPVMVKRRLAITISPKLKRRNDLVTVVPLSQTEPPHLADWHVPVSVDVPPPWGGDLRWAKCDMLATLGYARLNLPHFRHHVTGVRQFSQIEVSDDLLARLRRGAAAALGIVIAS